MNVAFVGSLDRGFAVIEWCKKMTPLWTILTTRKSKSW